MRVSFKHLIIALLLFLFPQFSYGQYEEEDDYDHYFNIATDSLEIEQRYYDTLILNNYKSDPNYNYENNPEYNTDFWSYIRNLVTSFIRKLFGEKGASTFWDLFEYGLVIMGIIFLLYALARMNRSQIIQRESKDKEFEIEEIDEGASSEKLDSILRLALEKSNFRVAVRIQFLKILKLLDQKEIISWKDFKTNADFANEIKSPELKKSFTDIRWDYENIWYGEFQINKSYYSEFEDKINLINDKINTN